MEEIKEIQFTTKPRTEAEIQKTARGIRYFLSKVHPTLLDNSDRIACVCILPIQRNKSQIGYQFEYNKPLPIWRWDIKTEEKLINLLNKINGQPVDLYYGVFNFNYHLETFTKAGKKAQKGIVNNENAMYSSEFFMDFDDCSEFEYRNYRKTLESIGIECLWVFTGHGYQAHILLNEKNHANYKNLPRFVYLARSRGLDIDPVCIDSARKSRLPQWTNYKCWEQEKYRFELNNPPKTKGMADTEKRYSIQQVFNAIETLPIVAPQELEALKDIERQRFSKIEKKDVTLLDVKDTNIIPKNKKIEEYKNIKYKHIDIKDYPIPIQKMLLECPEGCRNLALGFLIKWFKSYIKLSKQITKETLQQWNTAATIYIETFNTDFERFWNMNGLCYDAKLAQKFGFINFKDNLFISKEREIEIPNALIDVFAQVDKAAIKVYLALKMTEHLEQETTIENIVNISELSRATIFRGLEILKDKHHIYVKHKYKKNKEVYIYNTQKIIDINKGYTVITFNDAKCIIKELKNNSVKLYLYMLRKCFNNKYCTLNQEDLAVAIGVARNTITGITKDLEKNNYIIIEKIKIGPNIYSNGYKLKR